jgi:hypothetical protein
MNTKEYINPAWQELLRLHHMDTFDKLWETDSDTWYEPPNQARGGWSGVSRRELDAHDGRKIGIFIKRQENHAYRSWRHFFLPIATLEREFRNCIRFGTYGIPSLEVIYFAQRTVNGKLQAILITRELDGFLPLDNDAFLPLRKLSRIDRHLLIENIACTVRRMHEHRLQHTCLYPKHLFVRKVSSSSFETRFIDLEKARFNISSHRTTLRDLDSLRRHISGWTRTDQLRFYLEYRQEKRLSHKSKTFLIELLRKRKHN